MHCKLICQRIFGTVGDRTVGRDLNEKRYELITEASSAARKSGAFKRGVGRSTEK